MYAPWARSLRSAARRPQPRPLAASHHRSTCPVLNTRHAASSAPGGAPDDGGGGNPNEGREKAKGDGQRDGQANEAQGEPSPRDDENIFGEQGLSGNGENQGRQKKRVNGSVRSRVLRNRAEEMPSLQLPDDFRKTNIYRFGDERPSLVREPQPPHADVSALEERKTFLGALSAALELLRPKRSGADPGAPGAKTTNKQTPEFKAFIHLAKDSAQLLHYAFRSFDAIPGDLDRAADPRGLSHIERRGQLIVALASLQIVFLVAQGEPQGDAFGTRFDVFLKEILVHVSNDATRSLVRFLAAEDVMAHSDLDSLDPAKRNLWKFGYLPVALRSAIYSTIPFAPELGVKHNDAVEEALSLVRSDLMTKAPKFVNRAEIKRPVAVLHFPYYKGFTWPKTVVRDMAARLGADVLFLTPGHLARILSRHLGQDPVQAPGAISLLGYKTARYQAAAAEEPSNEDDPDVDAYLVLRQDSRISKNVKKSMSIMDSLMGDASNRGKSDEMWEDLKLKSALEQLVNSVDSESESTLDRPLIIHIHDFNALNADPDGNTLLNKIRKIVDGLWAEGRQITLVGSCSSLEASKTYLSDLKGLEASEHVVTFQTCRQRLWNYVELAKLMRDDQRAENAANLHAMLQNLDGSDFREDLRRMTLIVSADHRLLEFMDVEETLWSLPQVERLAKFIMWDQGDVPFHPGRGLLPFDVMKAALLMHRNDRALEPHAKANPKDTTNGFGFLEGVKERIPRKESLKSQPTERLKTSSDDYEAKMLSGLVNADDIKTTFEQVHAPKETIESIKLLTQLALLHPEAFSRGVLSSNRIPGCLLYGPPGTGKTLLAKAVAKESGANMIEISGASINDKYVGESEKRIQALFRLAKKKEPLVIFIDEADSLLADRGVRGSHPARRETINQFLREWDGMDTTKAFIMVATNRPFDLDEAVLRRLPRRLLIDLPLEADRAAILKIHLDGETLAADVSIEKLAKDTPMYSGSDLKNVCVAAAMAAVKEEMDAKNAWAGPGEYQWPAERVLQLRHFERALKEVSASVSEDMSSFASIRKFDEKYGEGSSKRKKKHGMGFGVESPRNVVDQARVRPEGPP